MLLFLITILISSSVFSLISSILIPLFFEIESNQLIDLKDVASQTDALSIFYIRIVFIQVSLFLIPSWIFYRHQLVSVFDVKKYQISYFLITIILLMSSLPLASFIQMVSDSWFYNLFPSIEISEEKKVTMYLISNQKYLLYNILVFAFLPAIGEELFFRGVLLSFFNKKFRSKYLVIFLVAIIFSFFHFEMQSFLARFFLGSVLGYIMMVTNNIIFPIIYHLINNSLGVLEGALGLNIEFNSPLIYTLSLVFLILTIRFASSKRQVI